MLGFFLAKPLWMKALMLAGAGASSYYGYKWFAGPSDDAGGAPVGGGGHGGHGHHGPTPFLPSMTRAQALAPATPAQTFVEWHPGHRAWVALHPQQWHERYTAFVNHYGFAPPHMARTSGQAPGHGGRGGHGGGHGGRR